MDEIIPVGYLWDYVGDEPPEKYAWSQGQSLSKEDYPKLYEVIGDLFGSAERGEFRLPDLRVKIDGVACKPSIIIKVEE